MSSEHFAPIVSFIIHADGFKQLTGIRPFSAILLITNLWRKRNVISWLYKSNRF
jgi:hypothetical protein